MQEPLTAEEQKVAAFVDEMLARPALMQQLEAAIDRPVAPVNVLEEMRSNPEAKRKFVRVIAADKLSLIHI